MRLFGVFLVYLIMLKAEAQVQKEIIHKIYFGGGSWLIDTAQQLELKQLIDDLDNLETYQISISSHTDNIGGAELNMLLSKRRSKAVIEELQKNQINPELIRKIDNGLFNPLYSNYTHEGRLENRCVIIRFQPIHF